MPGEPEDMDDEIIDTQDDDELLLETEEGDEDTEQDDGGEDEVDLELEGEDAPSEADDTPVIRTLRKQLREEKRRNRELSTQPPQQAKIEVGPKPTMEDPDVDWDQDKFAEKMTGWLQSKHNAEQQQKAEEERAANTNKAWTAQLNKYEQAKARLMVPGKDELEEEALSKLSQVQQAIIVKHPRNAEIMMALGKYPKRLNAISAVSDPVDFTYAVSDMARELKVTARRKAPEPEGIVRGGGQLSMTPASKKLEQLEKEAERTGDRTKIREYRQALKAKG